MVNAVSSAIPVGQFPISCEFSFYWQQYFLANQELLVPLPWNCDYRLTDPERHIVSRSLATFQLGESSEGAHLMRVARAYSEQVGDPMFVDTVKLFIGEEQRHAGDLRRFMAQEDIPLVRHHWSDAGFRRLRRFSSLDVALSVLLVAELIATVYYKALRQATRSPLLQQLCDQILSDEHQHVHFQVECLQILQRQQPSWMTYLRDRSFEILFHGTLHLVWWDHQAVFRSAGMTFSDITQLANDNLVNAKQWNP